jgi:glycosyltransferase involved in cell wall biosynthesis
MQKFNYKAKNILVDGRLLSSKPTGISRYTIELIKSYNNSYGFENVSVLLNNDIQLDLKNKKYFTNFRPFNILHYITFPLFFFDKKFDIFHSPFYSSKWFKLNKTFVITTVHDLMFFKVDNFFSNHRVINLFSKLYFYLIVKSSLSCSDLIISVSKTTQNDLIRHFYFKSIIIPEGVNFFGKINNDYKLPEFLLKDGYFLYVGNGRRHKNLDLLIYAFSCYTGLKKLVIIGNVNKNLEFNSNIIQYEFVSDDQLAIFYNHCNAFIFPSFYEGFGLPILEAISYKSIVFSSNAGALSEFDFNSLYFFNPNESSELLELMNNVDNYKFDCSDLKKLQNYNWEDNFNKFHQKLENQFS